MQTCIGRGRLTLVKTDFNESGSAENKVYLVYSAQEHKRTGTAQIIRTLRGDEILCSFSSTDTKWEACKSGDMGVCVWAGPRDSLDRDSFRTVGYPYIHSSPPDQKISRRM